MCAVETDEWLLAPVVDATGADWMLDDKGALWTSVVAVVGTAEVAAAEGYSDA